MGTDREYRRYLRVVNRHSGLNTPKNRLIKQASRMIVAAASIGVTYAGLSKMFSGPAQGWREVLLDMTVIILGVSSAVMIPGDRDLRNTRRAMRLAAQLGRDMSDGTVRQAAARAATTALCVGKNGQMIFWQVLENSPAGMSEEPELRLFLDKLSRAGREQGVLSREEMRDNASEAWFLHQRPQWREAVSVVARLRDFNARQAIKDAARIAALSDSEMLLIEKMSEYWDGSGSELAEAVTLISSGRQDFNL